MNIWSWGLVNLTGCQTRKGWNECSVSNRVSRNQSQHVIAPDCRHNDSKYLKLNQNLPSQLTKSYCIQILYIRRVVTNISSDGNLPKCCFSKAVLSFRKWGKNLVVVAGDQSCWLILLTDPGEQWCWLMRVTDVGDSYQYQREAYTL